MFMGYPTSQWLQVVLYLISTTVLFIAIYSVSFHLSNYTAQEQNRKKKLNQLRKNHKSINSNYKVA